MAISMVISEQVIDQVITHQFNSADDATKTMNSIEISGFGKFVFNKPKAEKKIEKLLKIKIAENTLPSKKLDVIKSKLSNLNLTLNSIKPKVNVEK